MSGADELYRDLIAGLADSSRVERTEEVRLEARLYDAFTRFPTLKAKQHAVISLETCAKMYAELTTEDTD